MLAMPCAHLHYISIHALHEESDVSAALDVPVVGISIHALHEESDAPSTAYLTPVG